MPVDECIAPMTNRVCSSVFVFNSIKSDGISSLAYRVGGGAGLLGGGPGLGGAGPPAGFTASSSMAGMVMSMAKKRHQLRWKHI